MTIPKKILVVALDNLGDAIMATSVLRPLKKLFPQTSIGVFVKNYAAEVLADHSLIDRIHAADPFWDRSPGRDPGRFADFAETVYDIRAANYDVAIVLNAEWRRALAIRLAGVPARVGFDRRKARALLTQPVPESGLGPHHVDGHRAVVAAFCSAASNEEFIPRLEVPDGDRIWWESWSARTGMEAGRYIVVHPFSGADIRNWPLDAWTSLIERFQARGQRFVVICSAAEKARLTSAFRAVPTESVHLMGGSPLRHTKAVVSRSRLFVGGDSGPAHMAAALGVPLLALYRPGTPARSGPLGRAPVRFITHDPIAAIELTVVETALNEILESGISGNR